MRTDAFDRWLASAEAQLEASRSIDATSLMQATMERQDVQLELSRFQLASLTPEARERASKIAHRIRAIDLRIHACGTNVMAVLDRVLPDSGPRTYGRRGQPRGV